MAGIKIVNLPSLGRDLASTDLFELSLAGGTGSRKITGQEILNSAKAGLVPQTRTLSINGTSYDLSADRSWTISTGIAIGTTPITSGTVGRVLFEGTGNVVQESANLFWDNTNGRLGIGISTPLSTLHVVGSATSGFDAIRFKSQYATTGFIGSDNSSIYISTGSAVSGSYLYLNSSNSQINSGSTISLKISEGEKMRIASTGNVLINTTTDAGYKLDVNGTARVQGALTVQGFSVSRGNNPAVLGNVAIGEDCLSANVSGIYNFAFGTYALKALATGNYNICIGLSAIETGTGGNGNVAIGRQALYFGGAGSNNVAIGQQAGDNAGTGSNNIYIGYQARGIGGTESNRTWIGNSSTTTTWLAGNVLIGTTTNAGYKLDVNGTARVSAAGSVDLLTLNYSSQSLRFYNDGSANPIYLIQSSSTSKLTIGYTFNYYFSFDHARKSVCIDSDSGASAPQANASAVLDLKATTKGFLPPRMTQAQRNAIASPAIGLEIYQTDATEGKYIYKSSGWTYIG